MSDGCGLQQSLTGQHWGLLTTAAGRAGGGVSEAVMLQRDILQSLGARVTVFALALGDEPRLAPGELVTSRQIGPGVIGFGPEMLGQLLAADLDGLHLHGIWQYTTHAGTRWAKRTGRPFVISFHGMVDPWITGRGRAKKALARMAYVHAGWARADLLHALTSDEAADISRETGRKAVVIPNPAPPAMSGRRGGSNGNVLYLGRIHPKKNVIALVEAWEQMAVRGTTGGGELVIAGWGEADHVAELEQKLAVSKAPVRFVGPAFGEAKQALLDSARFMILPSFSEGLPMAILEAWAAGVPAIMTPHCHLPEGFVRGAALECGTGADSIERALVMGQALEPAAWQAMSDAALELARGPFSHIAVARRWGEVYAGLGAGSDRANAA